MEKLFEYISKEWKVISQAPFSFLILAAIVFGLAYLAAQWRFSGVIDQIRASNETLKERLLLKSEQAESYKERALKYDAKLLEIVDSSSIDLKNKVLSFVKNIRDFIDRYNKEERNIREQNDVEMRNAKTENDRSKAWSKYTNSTLRLSDESKLEFERRFKIDAILFRDELLSRLKDYKPPKSNQVFYEHPTNMLGFKEIADDLEKLSKMLPDANNAKSADAKSRAAD